MKEFNLEHALAGAPVVTRAGEQVTEIHYFKTVDENGYSISTVIRKAIYVHLISGRIDPSVSSNFDLFMAPAFTLNDKEYYFDDVVMLKGQRTVVNAETLPEIKTALMYDDLVKPVALKKMWAQMYLDTSGFISCEKWEDGKSDSFLPKGFEWIGEPVCYEVEE